MDRVFFCPLSQNLATHSEGAAHDPVQIFSKSADSIQMIPFSTPPKSWDALFRFIRESRSGREILRQFEIQVSRGLVDIQPYPETLKSQLQHLNQPSNPTLPLGAAFTTDGVQGTLLLDPQGPAGILAPFLVHEMTHSLDETLWSAARHSQTPFQIKAIIFDSECRAYRAQHQFLAEMKAIFPEYQAFCQSWETQLPFLNRQLLPDEIARLYR